MMSCGGKPTFPHEQIVGALADGDSALERIRLSAFVERHHDDRRAVPADQFRLAQEFLLAFLERNGIHNALALETFQAGLDDLPFRRVHHHRHLADVRFGRDEVEEARHRGDAVNHPFVHANVNDLRAVLDLLARDGERGFVIAGLDELREFGRTGDVRALADVQKVGIRTHRQRVESAQPQIGFNRRRLARRNSADRSGNCLDVRRRGAAATADDVQPAVLRPLAQLRREGFRRFRKTCRQQRIRQAGVRIGADVNRRDAGKFFDKRTQFPGP